MDGSDGKKVVGLEKDGSKEGEGPPVEVATNQPISKATQSEHDTPPGAPIFDHVVKAVQGDSVCEDTSALLSSSVHGPSPRGNVLPVSASDQEVEEVAGSSEACGSKEPLCMSVAPHTDFQVPQELDEEVQNPSLSEDEPFANEEHEKSWSESEDNLDSDQDTCKKAPTSSEALNSRGQLTLSQMEQNIAEYKDAEVAQALQREVDANGGLFPRLPRTPKNAPDASPPQTGPINSDNSDGGTLSEQSRNNQPNSPERTVSNEERDNLKIQMMLSTLTTDDSNFREQERILSDLRKGSAKTRERLYKAFEMVLPDRPDRSSNEDNLSKIEVILDELAKEDSAIEDEEVYLGQIRRWNVETRKELWEFLERKVENERGI